MAYFVRLLIFEHAHEQVTRMPIFDRGKIIKNLEVLLVVQKIGELKSVNRFPRYQGHQRWF